VVYENQAPPGVSVLSSQMQYIYLLNQLADSTQRGRRRPTRSFPLSLVHLSLTVRVDDIHPLEQWLEIRMFLELLEHLVKFLLVNGMQAIFCRQSRKSLSNWTEDDQRYAKWTHCTKGSQWTTYSGTSSTASCRKKEYLWPYRGRGSRDSNLIE
jgi:hypothetical protein